MAAVKIMEKGSHSHLLSAVVRGCSKIASGDSSLNASPIVVSMTHGMHYGTPRGIYNTFINSVVRIGEYARKKS